MRLRSGTGARPTGRGNGPAGRRRAALLAAVPAALAAAVVSAAAAWVLTSHGVAAAAPRPHVSVAAPRPNASLGITRTSCSSVAHIGDSTSVGMVSASWLPDAKQRLAAQLRDVGVRHVQIDASGGRSIVEELAGQQNGYRVATAWYGAGFRGCWVIALGTNDAANVAAGSAVGMLTRVQEMMAAVHGEPVLWVTAQTDLTSGPWSEANMQLWNETLVRASELYPNMRIFNWAGMVQPGWHLADGIHYTSAGYAVRATAIARALASAFPAEGHSTTVVVGN
ncbi:MAG TPA: SGNH/GDSL hydrolase family protein [Streptosporangiaceae bacterium]|nr:SGNH/GDSL hydrolase family protein [Streptosporangiaceae bacterium]